MRKIKVVLADDHQILRKGIAMILHMAKEFEVVGEASNGLELISICRSGIDIDIILLDINMPECNGWEANKKLTELGFQIPTLVLTMDYVWPRAYRIHNIMGCVLKDCSPEELRSAVRSAASGIPLDEVKQQEQKVNLGDVKLVDRELEFIKHCCSELTYKEIADEMGIGKRTVDFYREAIFEKLQVKSRVGLVLFAVKNNLI